jgi:hypothetical protein
MFWKLIPADALNLILEYDGRIKYENGKYTDRIHKNDERYNIITPIMHKKMEIMKKIDIRDSGFYFEFGFDIDIRVGLCYDYNFSFANQFEICYYDTRDGWEQIRTYI